MRVIEVNNVCQALDLGIALLLEHGCEEPSRAGPVLVAPWPVITVYRRPRERVLFSPLRDANPFFHLVESMWMLAGRRDAAFLNNFVGDFGERFAEPQSDREPNEPGAPGTIHDAYGYRWRYGMGFDQLDEIVKKLSTDPASRQAVLQMWDCTDPDCLGWDDLCGNWRTRPCNTHAYLRIRNEERVVGQDGAATGVEIMKYLDLTVLCRSNDIWWGAYGANAVHFSVLQEYLAARIDVGVGTLYQVSNNFHMYQAQLDQLEQRRDQLGQHTLLDDRYFVDLQPQPLVHDAESFDEEVRLLLEAYEQVQAGGDTEEPESMLGNFHNYFLSTTVWPMLMAHHHRTGAPGESQSWLEQIDAADWRAAATEWVVRRKR